MFSGTVKRNLDPFDECDTGAIWWALQEVLNYFNTVHNKLFAADISEQDDITVRFLSRARHFKPLYLSGKSTLF